MVLKSLESSPSFQEDNLGENLDFYQIGGLVFKFFSRLEDEEGLPSIV